MFDFEKFPVVAKTEEIIQRFQPYLKLYRINLYIRDQLNRSSSSILLNIAEGAGKFSKKDKRNFYTIARGSVQETVAILKLLKIQGHVENQAYDEMYSSLDTISRMLTGLIKSLH